MNQFLHPKALCIQSQVVCYLRESQKSFDFMQTNLAIRSYIERVTILTLTQKINKAYYENISYVDCTVEKELK